MCKQDYQILRRVETRIHSATTSGASNVAVLPYDEARFGIVLFNPSAGRLQLRHTELGGDDRIVMFTDNGSEPVMKLTFLDVGAFIWQPFRVFISTSASATAAELYLPTRNRDLDNYLRVEA